MNGEGKITSHHRERLALVYLRQSSMAQVRQHTESTMRQYGLAGEATRLGWAPADVLVIDTDLGVSGRWGVARLMEFARITDTLLIDADGVYDPADVNDAMLPGLQGA